MKNSLIIFLILFSYSPFAQNNWLKANLNNQWQFIKNTNNNQYELVIGRFVNSFNINDTIFYEYNLYPLSGKKMYYDSVSNSIIYLCGTEQKTHVNFNLPNGSYPDLSSYNSYMYQTCGTGISVSTVPFTFANNTYNSKKVDWNFISYPFHNDQHSLIYANGLGIVYQYNLFRNYFSLYVNSTLTLFQCKIDGVIYKNNISIDFIVNPISKITNQNFQLVFRVIHPQNRIFPIGSGYTSLLMIDTVWFHSFYEKDGDTLFIEKQQAGWMAGSDNFILMKIINMNLLSQGYSFNYRIEAIDKGLSPNIAYSPENGFYKAVLDSTVNIDEDNNYSFDNNLEQNFPNPFNSNTKIRFYVSKEDNITIDIYNILGQKLITLFDKRVSPGQYEVDFNADKLKNISSSNLYFYQMRSSYNVITKKMLFQK